MSQMFVFESSNFFPIARFLRLFLQDQNVWASFLRFPLEISLDGYFEVNWNVGIKNIRSNRNKNILDNAKEVLVPYRIL
jgi:hypothetical protein